MTTTLQAPPLRARPISPSWRNLLLSAHIIASVGLLGTDAAVLTLAIAGWRHADPRTIYPAAHLIGLWLLLPLAVASVLTGLALGDAAHLATAVHAARPSAAARLGLPRDTAAASTVLITIVLLAVVKPFGRLRPRS